MLSSSESANGVARRHDVPSRELRFDLRDNSGATHEKRAETPGFDLADVNSPLTVMPAMTRGDSQNTSSWSPVFTFFMESFAVYGASYGALLHAAATSPEESCPAEASAQQPMESSSRERRRLIAIVSSKPEVTGSEPENDIHRNGRGSPSENADLAGLYGSPSFDTDRSNQSNWLTKPWIAIASRWEHWRREREINRAVAGLAKLDDQTLRGIGIPHRSQIKQVVRYCRDC
jgi:uncharacterized protein YjiS (DUF1127 family)